jgi:hypothetical protein
LSAEEVKGKRERNEKANIRSNCFGSRWAVFRKNLREKDPTGNSTSYKELFAARALPPLRECRILEAWTENLFVMSCLLCVMLALRHVIPPSLQGTDPYQASNLPLFPLDVSIYAENFHVSR